MYTDQDSNALIRYAGTADIPTLLNLFRTVVASLDIYSEEARQGEIQKYNADYLSARLKSDPYAISLYIDHGIQVGFCITDDQHGPIWIDWYGVHANARRKGVGERLIEHLVRNAPLRNATRIWCDTRTTNAPSIALFKKLGFTRLCELNRHWYGQDFYLWERLLEHGNMEAMR